MPNIGVINEQGFPFEDTGMGYNQLNEADQKVIQRDTANQQESQEKEANR